MNPMSTLENWQAPCGRLGRAENYQDHDGEVVVTQEMLYSCGCQWIRHEYHDGAVSSRVVRHDGQVLVDELLTAQ
jgi:hypothetical protein